MGRYSLVEQCLVQTLKRGDIAVRTISDPNRVASVADGYRSGGRDAAALGALLIQPQSDLSWLALRKLQARLRKAAEHTIPGLLRRIGRVVKAFTRRESMNFLRHAGYVQA
jgi:hypothetical protein